MPIHAIDAAIVGGGIAGAWVLNLLRGRGYNVVLLENNAIGCGQTLASQGMIHGGLKYTLSGSLTGASEAIAGMPARWRQCLAGDDEVDLRGTRLLADVYHMFSANTALGRLTSFFASKALRGRIEKLPPEAWPNAFQGFDGVVYALNDFVMDTSDLLATLTNAHAERIYALEAGADTISARDGGWDIQLNDVTLHARQLISCAGNGAATLIDALDIPNLEVQHRPLKQVIVHTSNDVHLYAHCLTGVTSDEPRLTITTHKGNSGTIWYLGGQLAEDGVKRDDAEQIAHARGELETCVPWLDWSDASFEVLTINRAEPKQSGGRRPDEAYVAREGSFIQCFPTKLTLTPDLGDQLLSLIEPPLGGELPATAHPRATIGAAPW